MDNISSLINDNRYKIEKTLKIGFASWDKLIKRIHDKSEKKEFDDEQIWTFLMACNYAMEEAGGAKRLADALTEGQTNVGSVDKIWFEVLPARPRSDEGNTHIDLAVGNIEERSSDPKKNIEKHIHRVKDKWGSDIQYDGHENGFVCFCECKWHSDIDVKVTYDLHRNQLIRVIENALCFQKKNSFHAFPNQVHVTLITPNEFKTRRPWSRFYHYKYYEYFDDRQKIIEELNECKLAKRTNNFNYPEDISERLSKLHLHWVTFEELFRKIPDTVIRGLFEHYIHTVTKK